MLSLYQAIHSLSLLPNEPRFYVYLPENFGGSVFDSMNRSMSDD